jgi:hypothetical protein
VALLGQSGKNFSEIGSLRIEFPTVLFVEPIAPTKVAASSNESRDPKLGRNGKRR